MIIFLCFLSQCDPNLEVFAVWINTLDPRLPRIALFSKRDIEKGEELTFDYMMTGECSHVLCIEENQFLITDFTSPELLTMYSSMHNLFFQLR